MQYSRPHTRAHEPRYSVCINCCAYCGFRYASRVYFIGSPSQLISSASVCDSASASDVRATEVINSLSSHFLHCFEQGRNAFLLVWHCVACVLLSLLPITARQSTISILLTVSICDSRAHAQRRILVTLFRLMA